ncbi:hypothetical protein COBT_000038 [Conglomerata obtusa]
MEGRNTDGELKSDMASALAALRTYEGRKDEDINVWLKEAGLIATMTNLKTNTYSNSSCYASEAKPNHEQLKYSAYTAILTIMNLNYKLNPDFN